MRVLWLGLLVLMAGAATQAQVLSMDYAQVVNRLVDLEALAVLPAPGEKCQQWSSWDRSSVYDASTDTYLHWDANGDHNGHIRTENGRQVLAEMDGPGVIWRIWSAAPGDGRVSIYIDGQETPQIDLPFKQYFDNTAEPFRWSGLSYVASLGWNTFLPIPFQRSCKVVADPNWGAYYHFTWTRYPDAMRLPSFSSALVDAHRSTIDRVDRILRQRRGADPAGDRPGQRLVARRFVVLPGKTATLAALSGEGAITAIRLQPDIPCRTDKALRSAALQIRWDGSPQPSVWSPVGDFFGSGPGWNPYRTLPVGVHQDAMYAYWYMPYAQGALVELVNDGDKPFQGSVVFTVAPLQRPLRELGRFHAWWHRGHMPLARKDRQIDWPMLRTQGTGRFVGVMLEVWNPRGGWWGEGDEKFHIDGEPFPSTFGTGSEDYFGYAWCHPGLFQQAFHAQTRNDGDNKGHVSVNRWHIADNVPFHVSFDGYIEKYFTEARPTRYAALACWYQQAGQAVAYRPAPVSDRFFYEPARRALIPGRHEGEDLPVLSVSKGTVTVQELPDWSNDAHAWWTGGEPGAGAVWSFRVAKAGQYRVTVRFTKARDYGIVQPVLNGQTAGGPLDLFHAAGVITESVDLGVHPLRAGENRFELRLTGANPAAVPSYMAGIDYIQVSNP